MAQVKYVVEGGCVGCSMGSATTTLKGKTNSRIGSQIQILEPDTGTDSFEGNFGICKTLTSRNNGIPTTCAMSNIPKWLNTNADYISSSEYPGVTMDSFTVCTAGCGLIVPLEDGQTMEDFDFEKFADKLPDDLKNLFKGIVSGQVLGVDPVNMSTGNFIYFKNDIEIQGRFPLFFMRFYNVIDDTDSVLGKNWTHNYNIYLYVEDRTVKISFLDGHEESYYQRDDGSYLSAPEHLNTLEHNDNHYVLTTPTMERYNFDNQGKLLSIIDANNNTTELSYKSGLLIKVSNACGSLAFTYNKSDQIIRISDHIGRIVSYKYDNQNNHFLMSATHPSGAVHRYEYGPNGKMCSIIDPLEVKVIHNEYDQYHRTVKQCYPDGGFSTVEYNAKKRSNTTTEQNGNQITYVYDENYLTTHIIYGDSQERFEYNRNHKETLHVDRNGNSWRSKYDDRGNLTMMTDPMGYSSKIEYNAFNMPTKITGPLGDVVKQEYDAKGNLIKSFDPLLRELQFKYENRGLVAEMTLPDDSRTLIEYDERGNVTGILNAQGKGVRYEYNNLNRMIKATNGEGHSTLFEYNAKGDIIKVTDSQGNVRQYTYDQAGRVIKITEFDGSVIEYKYNNLGKIEEFVDQAGGRTRLTYDKMWNVDSVTDPNGNTFHYGYDQYQRVVQTVDEEGNITKYEHDPNGNVTAIIFPTGARTEIKYDAVGQQIEILEPDGAVTKQEYDGAGNLVRVTDAFGHSTTQEFDLAMQLIAQTDPLGNKTVFTYTALGNISSITNAKGEKQEYAYYPGGKLKSVKMTGGEGETYEYDRNGNVCNITDTLGNKTLLTYDCLDRLIEITDPAGYSKKVGYDALGNIISITDELGHVTQYKYSASGNITEVIDACGHSTKYDYDGNRQLTRMELFRMIDHPSLGFQCPEYQVTSYERNKKGEVTAVKSPVGRLVRFQYDGNGNVVSKIDEDGLKTLYEYNLVDKLGRV